MVTWPYSVSLRQNSTYPFCKGGLTFFSLKMLTIHFEVITKWLLATNLESQTFLLSYQPLL